ncbi:MAG: hypothetical protein Kow0099_18070 [Candidatus Abyssubacteria bacterium]
MPEPCKDSFPSILHFIALAALLAAISYYALTTLRIDYRNTAYLDLEPRPDATEYFAGAVSLYHNQRYTIQIGAEEFPPLYPFGYSLAMLPAMHVLSTEEATIAPFRTNQILGLLMVLGLFFYYFFQRRLVAAAVSVLVLVTIPGFSFMANSAMSEMVAAAMICSAFGLGARGLEKQSSRLLYLSSFAVGLATCVRLQLIFFFPLILWALFLPDLLPRRRLVSVVKAGALFLAGASPMLVYNWVMLGSPLQTGYHFWVSDAASVSYMFSLRNISENLRTLWWELSRTHEGFDIGHYLTVPFLGLAVAAAIFYPKNRCRAFLLFVGILFLGVTFCYRFNGTRFYYPAILLAVPAIAALAENLFAGGGRNSKFCKTAFGVALALALTGFPDPRSIFRSWELLNLKRLRGMSVDYYTISRFLRLYDDGNSLVISPISPVYFNSLLTIHGSYSTALSLREYGFSKIYNFTEEDLNASVSKAMENGQKVFFISQPRTHADKQSINLPQNHIWKPVDPAYQGIYMAVKAQDGENRVSTAKLPKATPEGMVYVPDGYFQMGSHAAHEESPVRAIFTKSFYMDAYPVTNAQYKAFLDATGYDGEPDANSEYLRHWKNGTYPLGQGDHPVTFVSWKNARAYAVWAGKRLPTEAEWEKAARGADGRMYPWGDTPPDGNLCNFADVHTNFAWSDRNTNDGFVRTSPVGHYEPGKSPYGVYDMAGNVWEWCSDWYDEDYYSYGPYLDPQGPEIGHRRAVRGGCWNSAATSVRSAHRKGYRPQVTSSTIGFRCVKDVE